MPCSPQSSILRREGQAQDNTEEICMQSTLEVIGAWEEGRPRWGGTAVLFRWLKKASLKAQRLKKDLKEAGACLYRLQTRRLSCAYSLPVGDTALQEPQRSLSGWNTSSEAQSRGARARGNGVGLSLTGMGSAQRRDTPYLHYGGEGSDRSVGTILQGMGARCRQTASPKHSSSSHLCQWHGRIAYTSP